MLCVMQTGCSDAVADWPSLTPDQRHLLINHMTRTCGLPADRLELVGGEELRFRPSPDDAYERVDCLLGQLRKVHGVKLSFVGNEAYVNTDQ